MTKTKKKVPVTMRALTQRINRHFASHVESRGQRLYQNRGDGRYYVVDADRTEGIAVDVTDGSVEKLGRKLGVLKPWEQVES